MGGPLDYHEGPIRRDRLTLGVDCDFPRAPLTARGGFNRTSFTVRHRHSGGRHYDPASVRAAVGTAPWAAVHQPSSRRPPRSPTGVDRRNGVTSNLREHYAALFVESAAFEVATRARAHRAPPAGARTEMALARAVPIRPSSPATRRCPVASMIRSVVRWGAPGAPCLLDMPRLSVDIVPIPGDAARGRRRLGCRGRTPRGQPMVARLAESFADCLKPTWRSHSLLRDDAKRRCRWPDRPSPPRRREDQRVPAVRRRGCAPAIVALAGALHGPRLARVVHATCFEIRCPS